MKPITLICTLALTMMLITPMPLAQTSTTAAPDTTAVRDAETRWLNAYYNLDATAVDGSESGDFTAITSSQSVDKAGHLQTVRSLAARSIPRSSEAPYTLTDQRIRMYGDVAVISDVCNIAAVNPLTSAGRYYQTEVWHNESGAWKIVHFHISAMAHRM